MRERYGELIRLRKELHTLAEASGREEKTAARMKSYLRHFEPDELIIGLGGHGLAAVFRGKEPGPRVAFRAELDALPARRCEDFGHASLNECVAHKCGHDGHMVMVAGLGFEAALQRPERGSLMLLFQPAEEDGTGAAKMVADPKWAGIKPDMIFALHNLPGYKLGKVVTRSGVICPASIGVKLSLRGKRSHASQPHEDQNPTHALMELMHDIPRIKPGFCRGSFATLTHVCLGEPGYGFTPGQAMLMATLRAMCAEDLEHMLQKVHDKALDATMGTDIFLETEESDRFDITENTESAVELVSAAARECGFEYEEPDRFPFSEDFGVLISEVGDGAFIGIGAGQAWEGLHTPGYDFPDALVPKGLDLLTALAHQALRP